ncbi:MAG: MarR family transcriptional regulator [Alphaproteobacteria bacterium]|nr:MarR family transcriptional regulator [Alphaproteobacteria bacterium]
MADRSELHGSAPQATLGCTCFRLRRATRRATQIYDRHLQECGLRITQYSLLMRLRARGPVTVSELADVMAMDRTTLTRNLKPLERAGLIAAARGRDRRSRTLSLSEEGDRLLSVARPVWQRAQDEVNARLGVDTVAELHRLLDDSSRRLADP